MRSTAVSKVYVKHPPSLLINEPRTPINTPLSFLPMTHSSYCFLVIIMILDYCSVFTSFMTTHHQKYRFSIDLLQSLSRSLMAMHRVKWPYFPIPNPPIIQNKEMQKEYMIIYTMFIWSHGIFMQFSLEQQILKVLLFYKKSVFLFSHVSLHEVIVTNTVSTIHITAQQCLCWNRRPL